MIMATYILITNRNNDTSNANIIATTNNDHATYCYLIRPIFKLRIFKFGVWAEQILKRRRWIFLARRLIS